MRATTRPALLCSALLCSALLPAAADADKGAVQFDEQALRQRGLDPALAQYFAQAPRFVAGVRVIELEINGQPMGRIQARFDEQGQLCFDAALMRQARLRMPPGQALPADDQRCEDFPGAYPTTVVELLPNQEKVRLLVTHAARTHATASLGRFERGGVAGLLNYEVFGTRNDSWSGRQQQVFGSTEWGLNAGDWIVRSRQSFSRGSTGGRSQWLHTYAQTTLREARAIVQVGQLNLNNNVLAGVPITGLQWQPDGTLQGLDRALPAIEGTAQGPARVEVRQGQALIYSTLVPQGPFRLMDVKPLNHQADLQVRVIESDGQSRDFAVPIATLGAHGTAPAGLAWALGRVRSYGGYSTIQTPWVASVSQGWALGSRHTLSLGTLASDQGYLGAGAALDGQWSASTGGALTLAMAQASQPSLHGAGLTASVRHRLGQRLSLSASVTQRSAGYLELGQTLDAQAMAQRAQRTQGLAMSWSDPSLGAFSLNYSQSSGAARTRRLAAGWSKKVGHANLSARLERDLAPAEQPGRRWHGNQRSRTGFYLSASLPLGTRQRLSTYARDDGRGLQAGAQFSAQPTERFDYTLQAEHRQGLPGMGLAANAGWRGSGTQLAAGINDGNGTRTYTGSLSGGIAVHRTGLAFSAVPLGDTFAIASVGDLPGVRLETPAGPVWTGRNGRAVIAQVQPFSEGDVRIDTPTLPRNVDVNNGLQRIAMGRGAVGTLVFDISRTRRVLLTVQPHNGEPLPKGSGVLSEDGTFVTTVASAGRVYLPDVTAHPHPWVQLPEGKRCRLAFELPEQPAIDRPYETLPARCVEHTS